MNKRGMNELNQKIKLLIHLAQLCGDIRVYIRRGNTRMVKSELDMFLLELGKTSNVK